MPPLTTTAMRALN
ncbi:hypothetical protein CGCSCA1_v005570 [Colletotrichum siamense]|nr:hypothetical protein CGCSCA1_v005570 [Colletotrichum siamense]